VFPRTAINIDLFITKLEVSRSHEDFSFFVISLLMKIYVCCLSNHGM